MNTYKQKFLLWLKKNNSALLYSFGYFSIAIGYVVAYLFGGIYNTNSEQIKKEATAIIQKDAIQHDFAQYDIHTGVWRWKTPQEAALSIVEYNYKAALASLPPSIPPRIPSPIEEKGLVPEPEATLPPMEFEPPIFTESLPTPTPKPIATPKIVKKHKK